MKYTLKHSIVIEATERSPETEIKELNIVERMKAKHAKLIPDECFSSGSVSPVSFIPVIAGMASTTVEIIEELDFVDLVKIVTEILMPFLSELGLEAEISKK